MEIRAGLSASFEVVVDESDTAQHVGSGDVPVLATPRVVALAERASVLAVASYLDAGQTSVGVKVELRHLRASAVGATVSVTARLVEVSGLKLTFEVAVHEAGTLVADGRVQRAVVDRGKFLERLGNSS